MYVAALALADFRSYPAAEVALEPGVTTFLGPNGRGKTNLVEALGYLATLSSHRVATDAPLVRQGAERAVVRASVVREGRAMSLELEITPGRANRARVNGAPLPRPRELAGRLRTVLFAPEDLSLVRGDPGERRRFLDDLLVARAPRFAGVRADYDRVLRQRNALLRSAGGSRRAADDSSVLSTLEVWDAQLTNLGGELMAGRIHLVHHLEPLVQKAYAQLSGGGAARLTYQPSASGIEPSTDRVALAAALQEALRERRRDELDRGVTLAGPHRDELLLTLGDMPAKGYASHGESWSYALALRLGSYELLRTDGTTDGEPVLILDDVFAELDVDRRDRLCEHVAGAEQVLVTAAVAADVPEALAGALVLLGEGTLERA